MSQGKGSGVAGRWAGRADTRSPPQGRAGGRAGRPGGSLEEVGAGAGGPMAAGTRPRASPPSTSQPKPPASMRLMLSLSSSRTAEQGPSLSMTGPTGSGAQAPHLDAVDVELEQQQGGQPRHHRRQRAQLAVGEGQELEAAAVGGGGRGGRSDAAVCVGGLQRAQLAAGQEPEAAAREAGSRAAACGSSQSVRVRSLRRQQQGSTHAGTDMGARACKRLLRSGAPVRAGDPPQAFNPRPQPQPHRSWL